MGVQDVAEFPPYYLLYIYLNLRHLSLITFYGSKYACLIQDQQSI